MLAYSLIKGIANLWYWKIPGLKFTIKMAKIIVSDIYDLHYLVLPYERDENATRELGLDPRLVKIYKKNGYNLEPQTQEDANKLGKNHFNGLQSSISHLSLSEIDNKKIVAVHLAPIRYLYSQAMKDFTNENPDATEETINEVSPALANVSLLVPVKVNGKYYLLGQIKGKAVGSGQIQAALVAGGVNADDLREGNPFVNALRHEVSEEVGLDLSYLNSSSFIYVVDEREIGNLNFAAIARGQKLESILTAYESLTKNELEMGNNLEVMALSQLDMAGLSLLPVEGKSQLEGVLSYIPSKDGLTPRIETRVVRPYTEAVVNWLKGTGHISSLLKKAGF